MAKIIQDKRNAIIETALKLFTERGFHGTPTSLIAKQAGVATGTLFHYFNTKEELINAIYLTCKENLVKEMKSGLEPDLLVKEKIRRIWYNIVNWGVKHPEQFLFFLQFSSSPYITKLTKEEGVRYFQFTLEIIQEGQYKGILKGMPPELLLDLIAGLFNAAIFHFVQHEEKTEDPDYWEMTFDACWDCIKKV